MLIKGRLLSGNDELSDVYEIRRKVFVSELGIDEKKEFDGLDQEAMHVIVFEKDSQNNNKAIATGRIYYDGISCQIGHIAVLKEYRHKKYGDFTVRMLLNRAFLSGIDKVTVITEKSEKDFFKSIGFKSTNNIFNNNGMSYHEMVINQQDLTTPCKK